MRFGFNQCDDHDEACNVGGSVQETNVVNTEALQLDVSNIVEEEIVEREAERWAARNDSLMTCLVVALAVGGFAWTAYQWFAFGDSGTSHGVYALLKRYPVAGLALGYMLADWQAFQEWLDRHRRLRWVAIGGVVHCVWPIFPW